MEASYHCGCILCLSPLPLTHLSCLTDNLSGLNANIPIAINVTEVKGGADDFFMDSEEEGAEKEPEVLGTITESEKKGGVAEETNKETTVPASSDCSSVKTSSSGSFFDSEPGWSVTPVTSNSPKKERPATASNATSTQRVLKPKNILGSPLKPKGSGKAHLLLNYISIGLKTFVFPLLLDEYGKANYAYKPNLVCNILLGESSEWKTKPNHPAFSTATIVKRRNITHGPDEAVIGWKNYAVHFLSMYILCNGSFENVESSTKAMGETLLAFFKDPEFSSYYLGEIQNQFGAEGKLYNQLTNPKHKLYSIMDKAELVLHKMESLDEFLVDSNIASLIPVSVRSQSPDSWPESAIKKLYKSGTLPPSFLSQI